MPRNENFMPDLLKQSAQKLTSEHAATVNDIIVKTHKAEKEEKSSGIDNESGEDTNQEVQQSSSLPEVKTRSVETIVANMQEYIKNQVPSSDGEILVDVVDLFNNCFDASAYPEEEREVLAVEIFNALINNDGFRARLPNNYKDINSVYNDARVLSADASVLTGYGNKTGFKIICTDSTTKNVSFGLNITTGFNKNTIFVSYKQTKTADNSSSIAAIAVQPDSDPANQQQVTSPEVGNDQILKNIEILEAKFSNIQKRTTKEVLINECSNLRGLVDLTLYTTALEKLDTISKTIETLTDNELGASNKRHSVLQAITIIKNQLTNK